jgi:hypothetical protein
MVALLGQHTESETYALLKVVPFWSITPRKPFRYRMESLFKSSVRMKTMLGRSAAAAVVLGKPRIVSTTTPLASSTADDIAANSRTVLFILVRPPLMSRSIGAERPSTHCTTGTS